MRAPFPIRRVVSRPINPYTQTTYLVNQLTNIKSQWEEKLVEIEKIHEEMKRTALKGEQGIQGEQGPPGESGVRGIRGLPGMMMIGPKGDAADPIEVAQVLSNDPSFIEKITPQDGQTPEVDYEQIVQMVMGRIRLPKDGKDGSIDMQRMLEQFSEMLKKKKLSKDHIDGLDQTISAHFNQLVARGGYLHGGGVPSLAAGSGIALDARPDGGFIVRSTSVSITKVRDEVAAGSGTAFFIAHTPIANTLQLFRDGARQSVNNGDYTIIGVNITLTNALATGETLTADYEF